MTTTPIHDEVAGDLARRAAETWAVWEPAADADHADDADHTVLTADVRWALGLAREEAAALGHPRCGTGHLVLGLVRAGGPVAGLLVAAGVMLGAGRRALTAVAPPVIAEGAGSSPGWSAAAETVLVATWRAASRQQRAEAGAEDLLYALLERPTGQAAEVLAALDVERAELADAAEALRALAVDGPPEVTRPPWRDPSRLLSAARRSA